MASERKSFWEDVSISSARDKEALRSWLPGVLQETDDPIKLNILTRVSDDRLLKLRVLIRRLDGTEREVARTFGANFTVTIGAPTKQRWA